jgi:hypothetical protein
MGIAKPIRNNIFEFIIKAETMGFIKTMQAEGCIPGPQTDDIKRKTLERVGFQNPFDMVIFCLVTFNAMILL